MQHIAALKLKNPGDNSFRVQSQIIKDALLRKNTGSSILGPWV